MKWLSRGGLTLVFLGGLALLGWFLATQEMAVMHPKGLIGHKERDLILTALWLMLIVVIPVFIFTGLFAWRYRANQQKAKYTPDWAHHHVAEALWWGIPCVIIAILAVITWKTSHELNPDRPIVNGKPPLTIQVVALDWKWLFLYPEQGIATVNFIQFPVDTPLVFEITADAPMNSFWIPALGGQIYAMPAMTTKLHLIANEEGSFRGCSANLSGKGFAGMTFTAQATSDADFDLWVHSVSESAPPLNLSTYAQLMQPSESNPVAYYRLSTEGLFEHIVMKYMHP